MPETEHTTVSIYTRYIVTITKARKDNFRHFNGLLIYDLSSDSTLHTRLVTVAWPIRCQSHAFTLVHIYIHICMYLYMYAQYKYIRLDVCILGVCGGSKVGSYTYNTYRFTLVAIYVHHTLANLVRLLGLFLFIFVILQKLFFPNSKAWYLIHILLLASFRRKTLFPKSWQCCQISLRKNSVFLSKTATLVVKTIVESEKGASAYLK